MKHINDYAGRLGRLRKIADELAEAVLVTDIKNIFYLTGFTGSSALLIVTKNRALFYTDFRYKEQSAAETGGL
jgi:Xaa-Pro aminopeptidase